MEPYIQQVVTTISSVVVVVATAIVNQRMKERDRVLDERHEETEKERQRRDSWREGMSSRVGRLETVLDVILELQLSQMRSDLVHRAHRYVDDRGAASTEEKDVFWQQYQDYIRLCDAHGKDNNFIDRLAQQVMDLPTRDYEKF